MGVSNGFKRKIHQWMMAEDGGAAFRPFLVDGNPYKSRIFVAGAFPQPVIDVEEAEYEEYVESLVDAELWDAFYGDRMQSRENKGTAAFIQWLKEACGETAVNVGVTALMADSSKQLKEYGKESPGDYKKGFAVFQETAEEFQPEFLILHGADAVKQFRKQFGANLSDHHPQIDKVQDLEEVGVFAEWHLANAGSVKVLACRNLSHYGKNGEAFEAFRKRIRELVAKTGNECQKTNIP